MIFAFIVYKVLKKKKFDRNVVWKQKKFYSLSIEEVKKKKKKSGKICNIFKKMGVRSA